jgi:signal transduction histidine kinase
MGSRFSMWMGWGPELSIFYNDAYRRDTLGVKHPWALGRPAREVWAEIWDDIGPRISRVLDTGEATWDEDLLLFLERSGYREETYHTFSYSPLAESDGAVVGMLCVVSEETERVISERRLATLRRLGAELAPVTTENELADAVTKSLEANKQDLPFTLTYLTDGDEQLHLAATTGVRDTEQLQRIRELADKGRTSWPMSVLTSQSAEIVGDLAERIGTVPSGDWEDPPKEALLVPIAEPGQAHPAGLFVVGINPYRLLDADYQGFVELLVGQVAAALGSARAFQAEHRRAESLAELDRAKTTFFTNISHEFRTPLTLLVGPLEDSLSAPSDETPWRQRERIELAHRNAQRLLKLVNALLELKRASIDALDAVATVIRRALERARLASTKSVSPRRSKDGYSRSTCARRRLWSQPGITRPTHRSSSAAIGTTPWR